MLVSQGCYVSVRMLALQGC